MLKQKGLKKEHNQQPVLPNVVMAALVLDLRMAGMTWEMLNCFKARIENMMEGVRNIKGTVESSKNFQSV